MRISKLVHVLVLLWLGAALASTAQDDRPPPPRDGPTPAYDGPSAPQPQPTEINVELPLPSGASAAAEEAEDTSVTSAPPELRDPFWPVGYKPPPPKSKTVKKTDEPTKPVVVEIPPKWDEALKQVNVKGIMKKGAGGYMAVINNQICSEKDAISTVYDGRKYTWRIDSISAKGVSFSKLEVNKQ